MSEVLVESIEPKNQISFEPDVNIAEALAGLNQQVAELGQKLVDSENRLAEANQIIDTQREIIVEKDKLITYLQNGITSLKRDTDSDSSENSHKVTN